MKDKKKIKSILKVLAKEELGCKLNENEEEVLALYGDCRGKYTSKYKKTYKKCVKKLMKKIHKESMSPQNLWDYSNVSWEDVFRYLESKENYAFEFEFHLLLDSKKKKVFKKHYFDDLKDMGAYMSIYSKEMLGEIEEGMAISPIRRLILQKVSDSLDFLDRSYNTCELLKYRYSIKNIKSNFLCVEDIEEISETILRWIIHPVLCDTDSLGIMQTTVTNFNDDEDTKFHIKLKIHPEYTMVIECGAVDLSAKKDSDDKETFNTELEGNSETPSDTSSEN